jgi:hypothetical protein
MSHPLARLATLVGLLAGASCGDGEAESGTTPTPHSSGGAQAGLGRAPAPPYPGLTELPRPEDRSCAECHPGESARWLMHGMANAIGPIGKKGGDLELPSPWLQNPATGYAYRAEAMPDSGDAVQFLEARPAPAPGLPEHARALPVESRIGAGVVDLSLVLRDGDAWRFAPLEYLRHHGWSPSPQELGPDPPGLRHGITADCLSCHTPDRPPVAFPADALGDFRPGPIGCATCHGDGREHERLMRTGEFVSDPAILQPRDLSPARQVDLCARCHLEGDARIDRGSGLALPPPGVDLMAGRAVMVARTPDEDFRFVSQVRRMALSACFQESPEMSCTTCHDPHLPGRLQGRSSMLARCLRCHEGTPAHGDGAWRPALAGGREADCIDCHMPVRRPLDLLEVSIHDHFVRVVDKAPADPGPWRHLESETGDWVPFRYRPGDTGPEPAESEALVALARAVQLPSFETLSALRRLGPQPGLPQEARLRGTLEAQAGEADAAIDAFRRARALDPDDADAAIQLGTLLAQSGEAAGLAEAEALAAEVAAAFPRAAEPWRLRFLIAGVRDDAEAAKTALDEALAREPDQAILWQKLGRLQRGRGFEREAQEAFMQAYRYDPDLPGLPQDLRR